jgi:hypothetical protein
VSTVSRDTRLRCLATSQRGGDGIRTHDFFDATEAL